MSKCGPSWKQAVVLAAVWVGAVGAFAIPLAWMIIYTGTQIASLAFDSGVEPRGASRFVALGESVLLACVLVIVPVSPGLAHRSWRVAGVTSALIVTVSLAVGSIFYSFFLHYAKPVMMSAQNRAARGETPKDFANSIDMKFKLIPVGEFMMGSPEYEENRGAEETQYRIHNPEPQHRVRIVEPYYLGVTEVTQGQWEAVMGTRPWQDLDVFGERGYTKSVSEYAVTSVCWDDAVEFCRKLSEREMPLSCVRTCITMGVHLWMVLHGQTAQSAWFAAAVGTAARGIAGRPVGRGLSRATGAGASASAWPWILGSEECTGCVTNPLVLERRLRRTYRLVGTHTNLCRGHYRGMSERPERMHF